MRIGHLTWLLSNAGGGIPPIVASLAREQRRAGANAIIAGIADPAAPPLAPAGVPLILGKATGPLALGFSPGLAARIDAFQPEVLHLHGLFTWPSQIARSWGRRHGRPVVISPQGMVEPWALSNSAWKKRIFGALVENDNLARAACIQALSAGEATDVRKMGLECPIALVPNGFDVGSVPGASAREGLCSVLPEIGQRRVVLYLGRVHPKKGLLPLVEAWARIVYDRSDAAAGWVLVVAGPDQLGHTGEVKVRVRALGIDTHVIVAGPMYGADKAAMLAKTELFVLPSFSEGLPMALLEAMAWGIPVLATRACNVDVESRGAGLLCETEATSIAVHMGRLMAMTDGERRATGARGRTDVESRYAWNRIACDLLAVYGWLLGTAPRPECVQEAR